MGQKVNPISFRLGVIRDWNSRWFAPKEEFADKLLQDNKIRTLIMKTITQALLSHVDIERASTRVRVIIHAGRPGMIIGRKGAQITILEGRRGAAFEIEQISRRVLVQKLTGLGAEMHFHCTATAIDAGGVTYADQEGRQSRLEADHVVLALGMKTTSGLAERIISEGYRTITLKYCSSQRGVHASLREGAIAARQV